MMYKSKSSVLAKFKPLLIVPVILNLVLIFAFSDPENTALIGNQATKSLEILTPQNDTSKNDSVFFNVEVLPVFQDNGQEGFRRWIADNLRYPEAAKKDGLTGKVYVQFVVNSKGMVTDVKVVRGISPELDAEAIRVTKSSPTWEPGKHEGKNVNVQFVFPVNFVQD